MKSVDKFVFNLPGQQLSKGRTTWRAPSNIALVKYWGKYGTQCPKNPSLSFTLDYCATETELQYIPKETSLEKVDFKVIFDGKPAPQFRGKITTFLERIVKYAPYIEDYHFKISTHNTFPHSSGIASSASGLAALALCIMDIEVRLNPDLSTAHFLQKAGFLARLGSGSAARSIQGPLVAWGKHQRLKASSNLFGLANPISMHAVFRQYNDSILIVDDSQKKVSSSVGHNLMINHPFAEKRFAQADHHFDSLLDILSNGDLDQFIKLVESEALALHAMMMTSSPYYVLIKPQTLQIIERIWDFRKETGGHACFTLDAGANVHVLYPCFEREVTQKFIENDLLQFCNGQKVIHDSIGKGARRLN